MRQLIRTYTITGLHEITITGYTFTKEDVRLIIDETIAIADKRASVLVSSTAKNNIVSVVNGIITLASTTANLTVGDELTIEIDIDNVAKENTVINSKLEILSKIDNIPQPDLSNLATEANATANKQAVLDALTTAKTALQGNDSTATLTAIESAISALNNPTVAQIQAGLAKETSVKDGNDTAIGMLKDQTNGLAAIKNAIPTDYAKQGSDATATNSAIMAAIIANAGVPTLTIPSTTSSQELAPNTLYIFAERSSDLTITLGTPTTGIANEYHLFLITGSTAPTITWPSGISWNGGSAPTIAAEKTYEVSILNNIAAFFEV